MILMDPPRHDQLRALVSEAFSPRRIAGLASGIEGLADRWTAVLVQEAGSADFVPDFAAVLPAMVIADLLGVPREDRTRFRQWSNALVQSNPSRGETGEALAAAAAIYGYFTDFLAERRRQPRDDLMSALVCAEIDGNASATTNCLAFVCCCS